MGLTAPLLSNSNRLSSDDSGSDSGSGDDAATFYTAASVESEQPPVAAAAAPLAQRQISQLDDISARIGMINPDEMERSQIIQLLFGVFSRIALALNNRTLTEGEANVLYQLISQINIGDASRVNRLTRRQIKIFAGAVKRQNGYFDILSILKATSAVISPSYSKLTFMPSRISTAFLTLPDSVFKALPKLENDKNATLGS